MSLDTSPYHSVPELPLQTLVVLTRSLAALTPEPPPTYVDHARAQMLLTANEAEAAMIARLRARGVKALAADLAFDTAVDGLWILLRDRIRGWLSYQHGGLDALLGTKDIDFAQVRAKADRAALLFARLFGDGELAMLGRSYVEQVQLTANLLGLIEADGLEDDLAELAGPELLPLLRCCQREYEAMIVRRNAKDPETHCDFRELRSTLNRRVLTYATLMLSTLDESSPESEELIEAALEPMVRFRQPPSVRMSEDGVALEEPS